MRMALEAQRSFIWKWNYGVFTNFTLFPEYPKSFEWQYQNHVCTHEFENLLVILSNHPSFHMTRYLVVTLKWQIGKSGRGNQPFLSHVNWVYVLYALHLWAILDVYNEVPQEIIAHKELSLHTLCFFSSFPFK